VAGSYGNASTVGTFTVDAQGRLTAASNTAISIAVGSVSGAVPNTRLISTGTGLTGGGDLTADRTLSVTANSTQQLIGVQNNGTLAATRQIINFAPGNNVVITTSDDSANGRANVTIGGTAAATFATSVTTPTVLMNGATSGTITVKVPAVAGTTNFQLPASNGTSGYVLSTDGFGNTSWVAQSGSGGSGLTWQSVQTANFTATANYAYPVNTTSGGVTVTLPASPTAGQAVQITDYAGTFATNTCVVNGNGNKINSLTTNANFNVARESVALVYIDTTQGWIAYSAFNATSLNQGVAASYLIVAGGGGAGGGNGGGGGGAGGLLTGNVTLTIGTTYSFVVGAGAAQATNGSNSTGFGQTALGGGGGAGESNTVAQSGGSGGGGGSTGSTNETGGSGTSGQGNAGGTGKTDGSTYRFGGGGGGAGAAATNATSGGPTAGGVGLSSTITGTATYFSGGGGGGALGGTGASGGTGGGGAGGSTASTSGTAGTANTGGGGGGAGGAGSYGGGATGGSGVFILSVPTAQYTGVKTGSPTVTTSGSNTIMTFTASGSYTA